MVSRYVEVADDLRRFIVESGLDVEERIPSETALSKRHGVSRTTMRKSIELLVEEGILRRRRPLGTFVARTPCAPVVDSVDLEFKTPGLLRQRQVTIRLETSDRLPSQLHFWTSVRKEFSKRHPNVRVDLFEGSPLGQVDGGSQVGDVMILPAWSVPHYLNLGLLKPIDAGVDFEFRHSGFDALLDYGYPFEIGANAMIVNLQLLNEAGLESPERGFDFPWFRELLTRASGSLPDDCLIHCSDSYPGYVAAADLMGDSAGRVRIPALVEPVWAFFHHLGDRRSTPPLNHGDFTAGTCLFRMENSAMLSSLLKRCPFPTLVLPRPLNPTVRDRTLPVQACVSSLTPHPRESELFARFLGSKTVQDLIFETGYGIPAASNVVRDSGSTSMLVESIDRHVPFGKESSGVPEYVETVFIPVSRLVLSGTISPSMGAARLETETKLLQEGKIGWRMKS